MISRLVGLPILEGTELTIMVNGVGYGVLVPASVLVRVVPNQQMELWIHTHVREDALELFGFPDAETRRLFLLLTSVSGIGPKTALPIVNLGANKIIQAVQQADVHIFSQVPRVGKKLAQKIIIELRGKLGELKELDLAPLSVQQSEVAGALQSLGFSEQEIESAVRRVDLTDLSVEASVTTVLQELGKQK